MATGEAVAVTRELDSSDRAEMELLAGILEKARRDALRAARNLKLADEKVVTFLEAHDVNPWNPSKEFGPLVDTYGDREMVAQIQCITNEL